MQLVKRPARGQPHPVVARDLAETFKVRPCHTCYPDAPKINVLRRYCPKCNKGRTYACPHNGGLPVRIAYPTNYIGVVRDPGELVYKTFYVWPDQLYRYETGSHSH